MISFLNLQYFLLLSEELNFNNTAKKLHVTQQTLSGHIKKMEHDLGVKLFNYGPPLEITPAGLLLKAHAEVLLNQMKKMEMDIAKFKTSQSGSLKLGCTFSRAQFMMPAIIRDFQQKYPLVACCHYPFSKGHIIHPLPGHIGKTLAINYPSEEAKSPILKAFIQIVRENLQEYITDAGKE